MVSIKFTHKRITAQQIIADPQNKVRKKKNKNQLTGEKPVRRGVRKECIWFSCYLWINKTWEIWEKACKQRHCCLDPKKSTLTASSTIKTSSKKPRQQCHTMPFLLTHYWLNVHTFYTVTFTLEHQSGSLSLMCTTQTPPTVSTNPHPICKLDRTQKNKTIKCLEVTEAESVIVKTFRPEKALKRSLVQRLVAWREASCCKLLQIPTVVGSTTSLTEREREKTCPINEKSSGGGEPEGWRRTERRVVTGWEGWNKWREGERTR